MALQGAAQAGTSPTCIDFERVDDGSGASAIIIPIKADKATYTLQFDTGATQTILYTKECDNSASDSVCTESALANLLKKISPDTDQLQIQRTATMPQEAGADDKDGTAYRHIGTIGLDLLMNKYSSIDYNNNRLCISNNDPPRNSIHWTTANVINGKIYVSLNINGKKYDPGFFFDTGADAIPLSVNKDLWEEITRDDKRKEPAVISGSSWGNQVHLLGRQVGGAVDIGGYKINAPYVYYVKEAPTAMDNFRPAAGLMGGGLFHDKVVHLDLTDHARFGISQ